MAEAAGDVHRITIAAFERLLEADPDARRRELVDGRVVSMTNPTESHEQIVSNLGAPLKIAMDARECRTYFGGIRVQANDDLGRFDSCRPDLVVRCGPRENRMWITDPVLVVEVLSPSTIDTDRGRKLWFYKALPTMRHIVLVYTDQMRVEHYTKTADAWELEVLTSPGQILRLEAVDFGLDLARIYFDLDL